MWGILFVAMAAVFFALYLRGQQKEMAVLIGVAAVIVIFTFTSNRIREAVETLADIARNSTYSDIAAVLFKALGIAALVRIASDICSEAGEGTLATQIETLGKVEITLLSLPLVIRLLDIADQFLS